MGTFRRKLLVLVVLTVTIIFIIIHTYGQSHELPIQGEKNCSRLPDENEISFDNVIWQNFKTKFGAENVTLKLLNAYVDQRWNNSVVRISTIGKIANLTADPIYCQYWFENENRPSVVEASEIQSLWEKREKSLKILFEKILIDEFLLQQMVCGGLQLKINVHT